MYFLALNFQDEGHFYANYWFTVLIIQRKCLVFHFLSRSIPMNIPILTLVQNERINTYKSSHFLQKIE